MCVFIHRIVCLIKSHFHGILCDILRFCLSTLDPDQSEPSFFLGCFFRTQPRAFSLFLLLSALWTARTRYGTSVYKYWCKPLLLGWIASRLVPPPPPSLLSPLPVSLSLSLSRSLSRSLWWGDYGESDSWAQVSLPPGPAGCGTMTLLKFLQVFGFGDARQRGKAKARLSPECSSLRLSCPARGPVAAGLQQIKGWSLFSTEWCRCGCWLVGIPNLNLHLPRLRQSCSAFDWCVRSGS